MYVTYRTLALVGIALLLVLGWSVVRGSGREIGVLRSFDVQGRDLYTTLWMVDDAKFVWIRANRPDRRWLSHVKQNPAVELQRSGSQRLYRAMVYDKPEARAHVAPLFRQKYGLADRWRELRDGNDTVPVRLQPR